MSDANRSPRPHRRHNKVRSSSGNMSDGERKRPSIFERLGRRDGSRSSDTESAFPYKLGPPRKQGFKHVPNKSQGLKKAFQMDLDEVQKDSRKRERCIHWPNCIKGNECSYFHPTKICRDFPNCPNPPEKCMFIHPATSQPANPYCRYGVNCTNQNCTFVHPPKPALVNPATIPCKFFPNCANPACPYLHPENPEEAAIAAQPVEMKKVPIMCRDGEGCTKPYCHFLHPGENATSQTPCKYGLYCTRSDCAYAHPSRNKTVIFKDGKPVHVSDRPFVEGGPVESMPVPNAAIGHQPHEEMETDVDVTMQ